MAEYSRLLVPVHTRKKEEKKVMNLEREAKEKEEEEEKQELRKERKFNLDQKLYSTRT